MIVDVDSIPIGKAVRTKIGSIWRRIDDSLWHKETKMKLQPNRNWADHGLVQQWAIDGIVVGQMEEG